MYRYGIFIFLLFILAIPAHVFGATKLTVPFTSQAPYGNWSQPWQDFCEEASIVMVNAHYTNQSLDKDTAVQQMLLFNKLKIAQYGTSLDESTHTLAHLINNFYSWETTIVSNPSVEDIQAELDAGRPVIVPVAGKLLHNPNFKSGGPRYHMLVISGYDADSEVFITQEPGTRFGLDFRYRYDTIMGAIHDLVSGNIMDGPKQVLFTSPFIDTSRQMDGDADGLDKWSELQYGTILWLADSDGDGLTDGDEVAIGSHPTRKPSGIGNGSLIKSASSPAVYRIEHDTKRYIENEHVFRSRNWRWSEVQTVSEGIVTAYPSGTSINQ